MTRDDLFCAEAVGVGLIKLTVHGKNGLKFGSERACAEIILDDDDLEDLFHDLRRAQRAKVTISYR